MATIKLYDVINTYCAINRKSINIFDKLFRILSRYDKFNDYDTPTVILTLVELEKSVHNKTISTSKNESSFTRLYLSHLQYMLDVIARAEFAKMVLDDNKQCHGIFDIPLKTIKPSVYRDIYDNIDKSRNMKLKKAVSSYYSCSKCGNKECTEEQMQTASLDEAATVIIRCEKCGHQARR